MRPFSGEGGPDKFLQALHLSWRTIDTKKVLVVTTVVLLVLVLVVVVEMIVLVVLVVVLLLVLVAQPNIKPAPFQKWRMVNL